MRSSSVRQSFALQSLGHILINRKGCGARHFPRKAAISPAKQDDEQVNVIIAREEDELSGENGGVGVNSQEAIWPKSPNSASPGLERVVPVCGFSAALLLDSGDLGPYHTSLLFMSM